MGVGWRAGVGRPGPGSSSWAARERCCGGASWSRDVSVGQVKVTAAVVTFQLRSPSPLLSFPAHGWTVPDSAE